jgi:large subunit ribosomal protein L25
MAEMTVSAKGRSARGTSASKRIRREGLVPGIVYGGGGDSLAVTVDSKDIFRLLRSHAGRNTILNLAIEGAGTDNVILKDWQVDPVKETILHADFQRIAMDKALRLTIPIAIRGTAYGVKTEGGLLEVVMREVDVECMPADIPDEIVCDVTDLGMNGTLRVSDLPVPARVEILDEPDQVIVHVVSVKEEAAAEPAEGEIVAADVVEGEPELIAKGKKGDEESGG